MTTTAKKWLEPLRDLVVTRPERPPEKTEGGLYLPESARGRGNEHVVVACGPEVKYVRPGMRVFTPAWTGHEAEVAGEEYVVMREEEVLAIVREEEVVEA